MCSAAEKRGVALFEVLSAFAERSTAVESLMAFGCSAAASNESVATQTHKHGGSTDRGNWGDCVPREIHVVHFYTKLRLDGRNSLVTFESDCETLTFMR